MGNNNGSVEKISDSTYSWYLGTECLDKNRLSEKFTVSRIKNKVWFELNSSIDENKAGLHLNTHENLPLKLNLRVKLRYKNDWKEFSVKNCIVEDSRDDNKRCLLGYVTETHLLEIRCTFVRIEELIVLDSETGNTSENCEEKGFQDEYEIASTEINETVKLKGLAGLSENFKGLFLSEEDRDVTFNVGDKKYPAHKLIIKVRSPVFYAMLKNDMEEKKEGVINVRDCDPLIFQDFLLYVYTGKLDTISKENMFELFRVSDKYDVKDLKEECIDFVSNNLSVDIICDVISLSTRHCERKLLTRATEFFIDHAKDILATVNWQKFVQECPAEANELFLKVFNKLSEK